nr:hypothetical protein CFP56_17662 [Quercus suber]
MATELITWDANCEDVLCDSILGHYVCENLRPYHANAQVWEEIIENLNAYMGKAFTDAEVEEVTQRVGKRLVQDASGKGKKVLRKSDRVSEMTVALKEYTTMTKDRYSGKLSKSSGSFDQFAQSGIGGDPCSLSKAMEVLNSFADLSNKAYIKMSKVLQQKDNRTDSESERAEEVEFNLVNPIVEKMYAYMQQHYDKQPMQTSALTGKAYMDEITEGNPAKCYEIFRMTPELLLHLVDELAQHGYLRDGLGVAKNFDVLTLYASIRAIETKSRIDDQQWLILGSLFHAHTL